MLTAPTIDKLQALKLTAMATAWTEQQQNVELDRPRLRRALRPARRRRVAGPREQTPRPRPPGSQAQAPARLYRGHRLSGPPGARQGRHPPARHLPLGARNTRRSSSPGATGTGKSFIACALAQQACRKGYRAYYRRASRLFDDLRAGAGGWHLRPPPRQARPRGRARPRRLGPGAGPRSGAARPARDPRGPLRHPLDASSPASCRPRSGTITSANPTLADAICDRLLHNAHRLVLQGPSRRKEAKLDS